MEKAVCSSRVVLFMTALAAGCGADPDSATGVDPASGRETAASTSSGYVTQGRTLQGRTLQGRTLQGRTLQGTSLAGVKVAVAAVAGLALEGTAFVGTVNGQVLRGRDFIGAVFQEVTIPAGTRGPCHSPAPGMRAAPFTTLRAPSASPA